MKPDIKEFSAPSPNTAEKTVGNLRPTTNFSVITRLSFLSRNSSVLRSVIIDGQKKRLASSY